MDLENTIITVDNLNINYKLVGNPKAPIKALILHGWNQTGHTSWLEFLEQNTTSEIVFITLDLPCFGFSDCPDVVWDTQNYANFCIRFMQTLEQKYKFSDNNWTLIGHSFGGAIASLVSTQIPQQIANLILVAPAIIRRKPSLKQKIIQQITKIFNFGSNLPILRYFKPTLTKIWYKIIGSPDYNLTTGIKRKNMQIILKQDWTSKLSLIQAKSLLIWGTNDRYTPFSGFEIVSKALKPTKSLIYQDYGHGIHIQNPTKLYQDIFDFITKKESSH